jgi:hypothetical protein
MLMPIPPRVVSDISAIASAQRRIWCTQSNGGGSFAHGLPLNAPVESTPGSTSTGTGTSASTRRNWLLRYNASAASCDSRACPRVPTVCSLAPVRSTSRLPRVRRCTCQPAPSLLWTISFISALFCPDLGSTTTRTSCAESTTIATSPEQRGHPAAQHGSDLSAAGYGRRCATFVTADPSRQKLG